jgi:hypothetical protein
MNTHIKEALLRQKIKREIRKKSRLYKLNEDYEESSSGSLYTTFVEPFTDVLQAVNLGTQDFLNSYITYLRMWITWNPEKGEKLLHDHDERQAKIAEKWKPLMDRTESALSSGDADILALVLAPQVFALSAIGSKAAEYSGDVKGLLSATGLGGFLGGLIPDAKSTYKPKDTSGDILSKIQTLFFAGVGLRNLIAVHRGEFDKKKEARLRPNQVLREEKSEKNFKEDFSKFIEDTGIKNELDKTSKQLIENLESTIEKFNDEYTKKESVFLKLNEATTAKEFKEALEGLEDTSGSETKSIGQISSEMEKGIDTLSDSEEFRESISDQTKGKNPTEDEIRAAAEKVVFLQSKQSLETDLGGFTESLRKFKKSQGEQVKALLPTPAGAKILRTTQSGQNFLDFVEKTKQTFFIT